MNFKNKIIWITGASSGIGEALAKAFNNQEAFVILSSRNNDELIRVQKLLPKPNIKSKIVLLDLEDSSNFEAKTTQIINEFGGLDMLINNGGISQRASVLETNISEVRRLIEINLIGTIALTKAVLPFFIQKKQGHFVIISSVVGKIGTQNRSTYAATKHALFGFYDSLALEIDPRIKITNIMPGFVATNVVNNAVNYDAKKKGQNNANGMHPDEFAKKALKAIAKQKDEAFIGGSKEALAMLLKKISPSLFKIIMRRINSN